MEPFRLPMSIHGQYIEAGRSTLNQPLFIFIAEMGFGAGYVEQFLGDESEGRTGDKDAEDKR